MPTASTKAAMAIPFVGMLGTETDNPTYFRFGTSLRVTVYAFA